MNSLPPELLSSIIETAAHCDSTLSSYEARLETLSALALANRYLHAVAQPLLARKVYFAEEQHWRQFVSDRRIDEVTHVTYAKEKMSAIGSLKYPRVPNWSNFVHLSELRLNLKNGNILWTGLNGHRALTRLSIERSVVHLGDKLEEFAIPNLQELSLNKVHFLYEKCSETVGVPNTAFLSNLRFPSLRSLGLRALEYVDNSDTPLLFLYATSPLLEPLFLDQLECLTLDGDSFRAFGESGPSGYNSPVLPRPYLFDLITDHESIDAEASVRSLSESHL